MEDNDAALHLESQLSNEFIFGELLLVVQKMEQIS